MCLLLRRQKTETCQTNVVINCVVHIKMNAGPVLLSHAGYRKGISAHQTFIHGLHLVSCFKEQSSFKVRFTHHTLLTYSCHLKFIYSEKAAKFCEISTVDLTFTSQDNSTVEISQKFVAFSEYINFILKICDSKFV